MRNFFGWLALAFWRRQWRRGKYTFTIHPINPYKECTRNVR